MLLGDITLMSSVETSSVKEYSMLNPKAILFSISVVQIVVPVDETMKVLGGMLTNSILIPFWIITTGQFQEKYASDPKVFGL